MPITNTFPVELTFVTMQDLETNTIYVANVMEQVANYQVANTRTVKRIRSLIIVIKSVDISIIPYNPATLTAAQRQSYALIWQVSGTPTNPVNYSFVIPYSVPALWIEGLVANNNVTAIVST